MHTRLELQREKWVRGKKGRKESDYQPDMPPLEAGEYLIGYLFDVGPSVPTGMGAVAVRSEHLIPCQEETCIELQPWESQLLRRLSIEYVNESHHATTSGRKPPWIPPDYQPEPTAAQLALRNKT